MRTVRSTMVATPSPDHAFDHVVVVMFENRAFDHFLGYLYRPGEVPSFEGVAGRELSNPIPADLPGAERGLVAVHPATDFDTPDPDPGEEFPHVNTQLFGTVDPPENRFKDIDDMQAPFNAPTASGGIPAMSGFLADYANAFRAQMGRLPTYEEYAPSVACYPPDRLPVLSALARGFAVFDHWFCEVPSQTYPNRSFFHAASSSGYVLNSPPGKFATTNDAPTVFERLEAAQLPWKVYIDPAQLLSATALIHARRLAPFFATHFSTHDEFYEDARNGTLPAYAFLEPNLADLPTDYHPPALARLRHELHLPAPDPIVGGERLLAAVYDAVRTGGTEAGSNWWNTFLLVTFDEHGGTFDHVPPPAAPPPDPAAPAGEQGFRFDRLGVRVPTIAVSAWVEPGTVVTEPYRHTSMIRTLRDRFGLGAPLTERDASAPSLQAVIRRTTPRPQEDWPIVQPRTPGMLRRLEDRIEELVDLLPMSRLERDLIGEAVVHHATAHGTPPPTDLRTMPHRTAHARAALVGAEMFPGLARRRR